MKSSDGQPAQNLAGAALAAQLQQEDGIVAHGCDLGAVADDGGVGQQRVEHLVIHHRAFGHIKAVESGLETSPFRLDHLPVEPGIEDVFGELRQPAVFGDCGEFGVGEGFGELRVECVSAALVGGRDVEDFGEVAHGGHPLGFSAQSA